VFRKTTMHKIAIGLAAAAIATGGSTLTAAAAHGGGGGHGGGGHGGGMGHYGGGHARGGMGHYGHYGHFAKGERHPGHWETHKWSRSGYYPRYGGGGDRGGSCWRWRETEFGPRRVWVCPSYGGGPSYGRYRYGGAYSKWVPGHGHYPRPHHGGGHGTYGRR
jgi:hypothetical protein